MILTVTPNPALDQTYTLDALRVGEVMRVDAPAVRAGGKGVNVARVLAEQGEHVRAVVPLGGATGERFAAELTGAGVPFLPVPVAAATRGSVAIVDTGADRTTVMNEKGAALTAAEADAVVHAARGALTGTSVLVVSGSLPPGFPPEHVAALVRLAHEAGALAVADVVGEALLAACAAGADAVKPNHHELLATTGHDDPAAGARALLDAGARLVVVTLGERGMLAVGADDPARVVRARLAEPLRGNPTGAGDAAVAALALGLARDERELPALLRRAVAWSAAAVAHPLAGSLAAGVPARETRVELEEERWR
ncbi:1-phosphofructokinase family hexose kinase [Gryllotalpicola ginsengisoli]|uniref:1-phosphofructokinase family hexose kinase n=1 Tax=Gryllotalpicola ginsengisoli TaxID=444608 RepID=UPI00041449E1|nr:hexose kinase [Gryllotalpicola ginsengisoli]